MGTLSLRFSLALVLVVALALALALLALALAELYGRQSAASRAESERQGRRRSNERRRELLARFMVWDGIMYYYYRLYGRREYLGVELG